MKIPMRLSVIISALILIMTVISCQSDEGGMQPVKISNDSSNHIMTSDSTMYTLMKEYHSLDKVLDSLQYYEGNNDIVNATRIEIQLAERLRECGNYFEAISYLKKAKRNLTSDSLSKLVSGKISNGFASIFYELFLHNKNNKHYLDSADIFAQEALTIAEKGNYLNLKWNTINIIGAISIHRGEYSEARKLLEKAKQLQAEVSSKPSMAVLANLSYAHLKLQNFDEALNHAENCHEIALQNKNIVFSAICLDNMARVYDAKGDSVLANELREDITEMKMRKDVVVRSLLNKQILLNHENKQMKTKVLGLVDEKYYLIRLSRILSVLFVVVIVIGLILSYLIVKNYRKKKEVAQQRLQIQEQENKIHQDKVRLLEQNKKLEQEKAEKFQLESQIKDQELAYKSLKMANLAQLNKSVKEKLGPFQYKITRKKDQEEFQKQMNDIFKETSNDPLSDFEDIFLQMHGDFYKKLVGINPNLTRSELQLCALLRMNLPSKEIANLLSLSPYTIDQRRHSIRQKLGLNSSQNLNSYLINIC